MASSGTQAQAATISEISQLRTRIEAALDQPDRHYTCYFTFAIRFEKDDTNAEQDTANFQSILNLLGLPAAIEMVIPASDKTPPIWALHAWWAELIIAKLHQKTGPALIIGHYAGHGGLNSRGQWCFSASPQYPACFLYENSFDCYFEESNVPPETDVWIILDACYSEVATRRDEGEGHPQTRIAELIAAVGPEQKASENWSYSARNQNKTFTSRLAEEVAREVDKNARGINLADIISNLRQQQRNSNPDTMPIYQLKAGNFGIRIPNLNNNIPSPPDQRPSSHALASSSSVSESIPSPFQTLHPSTAFPADHSAIFQIHLQAVDPTGPEAQKLLEWLLSLKGAELGIELKGVYKTNNSTTMLLLFLGLCGLVWMVVLASSWCVRQRVGIC